MQRQGQTGRVQWCALWEQNYDTLFPGHQCLCWKEKEILNKNFSNKPAAYTEDFFQVCD